MTKGEKNSRTPGLGYDGIIRTHTACTPTLMLSLESPRRHLSIIHWFNALRTNGQLIMAAETYGYSRHGTPNAEMSLRLHPRNLYGIGSLVLDNYLCQVSLDQTSSRGGLSRFINIGSSMIAFAETFQINHRIRVSAW